jgi:hypothetical protein
VFDKKAWTKNYALVTVSKIIMSLLLSVCKRLVLSALLVAFPCFVEGQTTIIPQGNEFSAVGSLVGDQVNSSVALNQSGGYIVWEENGSLKSGSEIRAARLNSSFTKISSLPVNKVPKGDQRNPQVQLLNNGDAIFLWQSYGLGNADIYARVLKSDGSFATGDVRVNSDSKGKGSYSKDQQSKPVVCPLNDGGALVAWQSLGQDGSMMGIYARLISSSGSMVSNEFAVNQTVDYNQRTPAVATLTNGNVVVAWISEQQRFADSIDVYARLFSPSGEALSEELLLNSGNNICANPSLARSSSGGFIVVWSEKDKEVRTNGWDVIGRSFTSDGIATMADFKINATQYGDQYQPRISAGSNGSLVVWTSLGQDGSREGVYGRYLSAESQPVGNEFRVNTTTRSQQIYPSVAWNGVDRFLVAWSSLKADFGFDLFGQTFSLTELP